MIRIRRSMPSDYRLLLRDIFTAAGGQHDDWDAYDRTMVEQRRVAVFVSADAHLQQLTRAHTAKICDSSANALNSIALPAGS